MLGNIGPTMIILIVIVALLLFGPNKLPELGRAFGRTLKEFKKGTKEMMSEEEEERKDVSRSQDKLYDGDKSNDQRNNEQKNDHNSKKNNDNSRLPE